MSHYVHVSLVTPLPFQNYSIVKQFNVLYDQPSTLFWFTNYTPTNLTQFLSIFSITPNKISLNCD